MGFIDSGNKNTCFGCEACVQACGKDAISMHEDNEGFRYPVINKELCVSCGKCRVVCPFDNTPTKHIDKKFAFGGYANKADMRFASTSGGAFSAIAEAFCNENSVIFGAEADGLTVRHGFVAGKSDFGKFRKSKYSQSIIGSAFVDVKKFLSQGKKVLFSGTPCQIAGLVSYLGNSDQSNLLTVEVICEGVPSPLYVRKYEQFLEKKYGAKIHSLDYRHTGKSVLRNGKWDFEQMCTVLNPDGAGKSKTITQDRWFNPFWSIWLNHLMSRPSCYKCPFTTENRIADITLGDLWGVHIYCPELYGKNGGASLVLCNSEKGKQAFLAAKEKMSGHELNFNDALKYQGPLRRPIAENVRREAFMKDVCTLDYKALNKKWAKRPTLKLLLQKYIWGNRQKILIWNMFSSQKTKEE